MGTRIEYKRNHGIYYGMFPGRTRPTLFLVRGSVYTAIGWFRDEQDMDQFHTVMMRLLDGYKMVDDNP